MKRITRGSARIRRIPYSQQMNLKEQMEAEEEKATVSRSFADPTKEKGIAKSRQKQPIDSKEGLNAPSPYKATLA